MTVTATTRPPMATSPAGLGLYGCGRCSAVRVWQTLVVPDVDRGEVIVFNRVQNTREYPGYGRASIHRRAGRQGCRSRPIPDSDAQPGKSEGSEGCRQGAGIADLHAGPSGPGQAVHRHRGKWQDPGRAGSPFRLSHGESQGLRTDPQRQTGHIPGNWPAWGPRLRPL